MSDDPGSKPQPHTDNAGIGTPSADNGGMQNKQETPSARCCVKGCMNSLDEKEQLKQGLKETGQNVQFYKFPESDPRWKEWLKSVKMDSACLSNVYICSLHFSEHKMLHVASDGNANQTESQVVADHSQSNEHQVSWSSQVSNQVSRDINAKKTLMARDVKAPKPCVEAKKPKSKGNRLPRYKCWVEGCPIYNQTFRRRSRHGYSEDIHFFRFPSHPERCKRWVSLLDLEEFIKKRNKTISSLHNSFFRVCDLHFRLQDLSGGRLCSTALPDKEITRPVPMANEKPAQYHSDSDSDDGFDNIPTVSIDAIPDKSCSNIADAVRTNDSQMEWSNPIANEKPVLSDSDSDDNFDHIPSRNSDSDDSYDHIPSRNIDNFIDDTPDKSRSNIDDVFDDSDGSSSSDFEDNFGDDDMSDICTTPSSNAISSETNHGLTATHRTVDTDISGPIQVMLLKAAVSKTGLLTVPGLQENLQVVGGNYPLSAIQSGNLVLALPCKIKKVNPKISAAAAGATMCIPPLQPELNAVLPTCSLSASSLMQTREVGIRKKLKVIGRTTGPCGRSALIATADDCDLGASQQADSEGTSYTLIPPGTVIPIKMSQPMPSEHPIPSTQPVQFTQPGPKEADNPSTGQLKTELKTLQIERRCLKRTVHKMNKLRTARDISWRKKMKEEQDRWKEQVDKLKSEVQKLSQALVQAKEQKTMKKDNKRKLTNQRGDYIFHDMTQTFGQTKEQQTVHKDKGEMIVVKPNEILVHQGGLENVIQDMIA